MPLTDLTDDQATPDIPAKKLDTIRKLLAQADPTNGGTEDECRLAAERAAGLMARYAVTAAMVDATGPAKDDPMTEQTVHVTGPYERQKISLLHVVSIRLSAKTVKVAKDRAVVYGRRSDLARVDFLFTSLLLQATRLVLGVRPPVGFSAARTRSFRVNWLVGFNAGIATRMDGDQQDELDALRADQQSTSAEVVLADRFSAADAHARAVADAEGRKLRAGRRPRVTNAAGYLAGETAGRNADLGNAQVGGQRRALPGA